MMCVEISERATRHVYLVEGFKGVFEARRVPCRRLRLFQRWGLATRSATRSNQKGWPEDMTENTDSI